MASSSTPVKRPEKDGNDQDRHLGADSIAVRLLTGSTHLFIVC